MMKRIAALFLVMALLFSLSACKNEEGTSAPSAQTEESQESSGAKTSEKSMLVAYFSYAENAQLPDGIDASATASIQVWNGETTGNTGAVAAMIAENTGADLFSIQTVEPYPDTYDATLDRGQEEQSTDARPELKNLSDQWEQYDVIFLGFPKLEQGYICV